MQVIEIYLEPGEGKKGAAILDELGVQGFDLISSKTNDLITIRRPLDKTDSIISAFESNFNFKVSESRGIIVLSPDVVIPKEEYDSAKKKSEKSPWEVLVDYGENNCNLDSKFIALFFFSIILATLGLITNNVAVIVGAMIIAPAFGPLASASIGIVTGRPSLIGKGIKTELVGIAFVIVIAAVIAFLLPDVGMNESLRSRMYPTIYDLVIALAAGAAGGYVLVSSKQYANVVGVMVAAALVPVMAAIGISITFFEPSMVFGAILLLLANVVSIVFSIVLVLWFAGPKKEKVDVTYGESKKKEDVGKLVGNIRDARDLKRKERSVARAIKVLFLAIALIAIVLVWVSYDDLIMRSPEETVREAFEESAIPGLSLGEVWVTGNVLRVLALEYESVDNKELSKLENTISARIGPAYTIEMNVVGARTLSGGT